jgi:hypothetical protein
MEIRSASRRLGEALIVLLGQQQFRIVGTVLEAVGIVLLAYRTNFHVALTSPGES